MTPPRHAAQNGVLQGLRGRDEGNVLVLVLGSVVMVSLLLSVAVGLAVSGLKPSGTDQQAKAATAAAQAGIADYVARLNASTDYWKKLSADLTNPAFLTPMNTTGRLLPGSPATSYSYAVLTSTVQTAATGIVTLRSTGTSRGVSRTLTAQLQSRGFLQYLYQTDKETTDPALLGLTGTAATACSQYWYRGRSSASGCSDIVFTTGDVIDGRMHTNDTIKLNGSVLFTDRTETSWPAAQTASPPATTWYTSNGASPDARGRQPVYAPVVAIPSTNASLQTLATCTYRGATKITFSGSSMTVLSPNTPTRSGCYTPASTGGPSTITPVPALIYVQNTSGSTCLKAASDTTTSGIGFPGSGEYVGGSASSAYTYSYGGYTYGGGSSSGSNEYLGPTYACTEGTAYVSGTLDGATTIATAADIVVTADLTYTDESVTSNDVLGLIPTSDAWVYHPVRSSCSTSYYTTSSSCTYSNLLSTPVRKIDAAVLAVKDSFVVQNWKLGDALSAQGVTNTYLNVRGSIAQNFRGPVGTNQGAHGYLKNYAYDPRFEAGLQPPYFLQPVAQQWKPTRISAG